MKKFNKILCILLVLSMLIALLPTTAEAATKPKLNKAKLTLCVGQTTKLKVTNSDSSKVTWTSSNKKIAIINSKGKIKGKQLGTCTITATVGKKSTKCKVTVANHNWVKVDETGHYEEVQIGTRKYITDADGHGPFYTNEEWHEHRATGCRAGYGTHTEPVYETQWIVDTEAYYKCSRCESTK